MNPLISIIIPVYNAEKYLKRCIDSIIVQTFSDWELILVDDGSTDSSSKICDEYARQDKRITVCHIQNGGVSSARNIGIDKSCGEFIIFVDSDDYISPMYLETLVKLISDNDMACVGYKLVSPNKDTLPANRFKKRILTMSIMDSIRDFYRSKNFVFNAYIWNRIFRTDVIKKNNIRFRNDIRIKEDGLFLMQYLCKCTGCCMIDTTPLYMYVQNENSAMQRLFEEFKPVLLDSLKARVECLNLIRNSEYASVLNLFEAQLYIVHFYYWIHEKNVLIPDSYEQEIRADIVNSVSLIGVMLLKNKLLYKLTQKILNKCNL